MFKNITFFFALILSGMIVCIAAEPGGIPSAELVINSFGVGEITDLGHPVCTLSLAGNRNGDFFNYVEGDICPVGGGDCTYSAIMKLNGKITILKKISSEKNTSSFKNNDISVTTKQIPATESNENEEGRDVKVVIIIRIKNYETKLDMSGYCGV